MMSSNNTEQMGPTLARVKIPNPSLDFTAFAKLSPIANTNGTVTYSVDKEMGTAITIKKN